MDTKSLPDILTLRQVCDLLNVHPNTLRQWDAKGILPAIRFGARKDRRYKKQDVLKLLERKGA
ncbi:helix-turn-helix domain-containing protein [Candidatus Uhrbacteria bacterium]|nr:helix-turn-helix domain-containing protein [Candidatus Uhrbacteria bacterium]